MSNTNKIKQTNKREVVGNIKSHENPRGDEQTSGRHTVVLKYSVGNGAGANVKVRRDVE